MELPRNETERHAVYRNIIRECEYGRQDRRERFRRLKLLNLTGSDVGARSRFNSLKEWSNLSTSLIYASENVRYGVSFPPYYGDAWDEEARLAREELHRIWFSKESALAETAGLAVQQAHHADTSIAKLFVSQGRVMADVIADPSEVCVLDEHRRWGQQEAIVHYFTVSVPAFWRMLQGEPDEARRNELMRLAIDHATPSSEARGDALPPTVSRIILSSASSTLVGNVTNTYDTALAIPRSRDKVVSLAELWIWDDRAAEMCGKCRERKDYWRHHWPDNAGGHKWEASGHYLPDWRVATNFLATEDILWDPVNPLGIEGHPFFPLCYDPMPGYLWGVCPMEQQIALQLERERQFAELILRNDLDVDPPMAMYGVPSSDGERTKTYRKPGGDIPMSSPNARVEPIRPTPLPDKFEFIREIDGMQLRQAGIPRAMAGQTDPGVRSGEQAVALALLGAGPTMSRAMVVEDFLESLGTAALKLHRRLCDRPLVKADGSRFLLQQMPGDFTAKVWAHSASPIYTEQLKEIVLVAHAKGLITDEAALTFLNLPGTDALLRDSKKLQAAKAEMAKKAVATEEAEAQSKVTTAEAKLIQAKTPN